MSTGIQAPIGAGNKVTIHPISAEGQFLTAAFTFDKNVTMDYTGHPIKQNLVIDLDNKIDNEAYNTFLKNYLKNVAVEQQNVEYVDASYDTIVSGVQYSRPFGYIWYGGEGSDGKTKVVIGKGILSGDTGNSSYQGKGIGNYPVQITTLAHTDELTIPTTLFDACKVVQATEITIGTGECGTIIFMASA